jgi:predicted transcriptional regulator
MTITLDPELAARLKELAAKQGIAPEALALEALRQRFLTPATKLEPRDEWERQLLSLATDCGVSLPNEAFLAESLYE